MKMYDMGDENERKPFLDKLFNYMDEKGSPITSMPMISKNPIDLYKLYNLVKEKGGLLEVGIDHFVPIYGHLCNSLHLSVSEDAKFAGLAGHVRRILKMSGEGF